MKLNCSLNYKVKSELNPRGSCFLPLASCRAASSGGHDEEVFFRERFSEEAKSLQRASRCSQARARILSRPERMWRRTRDFLQSRKRILRNQRANLVNPIIKLAKHLQRPYSHETFWHTNIAIKRYCDIDIF